MAQAVLAQPATPHGRRARSEGRSPPCRCPLLAWGQGSHRLPLTPPPARWWVRGGPVRIPHGRVFSGGGVAHRSTDTQPTHAKFFLQPPPRASGQMRAVRGLARICPLAGPCGLKDLTPTGGVRHKQAPYATDPSCCLPGRVHFRGRWEERGGGLPEPPRTGPRRDPRVARLVEGDGDAGAAATAPRRAAAALRRATGMPPATHAARG